jgi:Secretion system C-terminal sorting domain/Photosynthesis system II assembly factor YCF48
LNDQVGFAVGIDANDTNAVRMTTDGGTTWNTVSTNFPQTDSWLYGITFVDQQGWIVSYDGYVYHSTDGGMNWVFQDSIRAYSYWLPIRDILFMTPDSGWAVGGTGIDVITARTTDGGDNWIVDTQFATNYPFEVVFVDSKTGWFTGLGIPNWVSRTTNGGIDWQYQTLIPPNASNGFESITMINENIGWMVGDFGVVYKTINGGVVAIKDTDKRIPEGFTLDQGYPNPFNPTTWITYSLPASNQVTLKVFNITGQVVATLVNERQEAGTHEVTFEAGELPGGIYFYKLTSGSFSQTRKMLMVK